MLIFGLVGLIFSFLGSSILAFNAIRSKSRIVSDTLPRMPVVSPDDRKKMGFEEATKSAWLKNPYVQTLIWQSKLATIGLVILAGGFALQLVSIIMNIVCPL